MKRARNSRETEEEIIRKSDIDLTMIPRWEMELQEIRGHFRDFDLKLVRENIAYLLAWKSRFLQIDPFHKITERRLASSLKSLKAEDLITISLKPWFKQLVDSDLDRLLVEKITSNFKLQEKKVIAMKEKGITSSFILSTFTSKHSEDDYSEAVRVLDYYNGFFVKLNEMKEVVNFLRKLFKESESSCENYRLHQIRLKVALERKAAKEYLATEKMKVALEKKAATEKFEAKYGKALAKAATADNKARSRAGKFKKTLIKADYCPYCGCKMGNNSHIDHIYPISMGGLSVTENLVWCCTTCNLMKSDKGLVQFLVERDVKIEDALFRLGRIPGTPYLIPP